MQGNSQQGSRLARCWRQAVAACGLLLGLGSGAVVEVGAQEEPPLPPPVGAPLRATEPVGDEGATSDARRFLIEEKHPESLSATIGSVEATTVDLRMVPAAPVDLAKTLDVQSHVQGDQEGFVADQRDPLVEVSGPASGDPESAPPGTSGQVRGADDVIASWEGLDSTGWIPPDAVVAVGEVDIIEAANSGFAIYSKLGRQIRGYTTFSSLLGSSVPSGVSLFDPRVLYNPWQDKYVMLIAGRNASTQDSYIFIMISQTNSAEGNWWRWRLDAGSFPTADSDAWMDYASLGADEWGIYFVGNMFYWTGGFKYAKLWTLQPTMWTGGGAAGRVFWDLRWPNNAKAFAVQAVLPHTLAGGQETFFVNTYNGLGSSALLWTLSGDRVNAPSLTKAEVTGLPSYYALGENVDQPGTTMDIDGGDSRVMNAVYANRRVFLTLGSDHGNDGNRGSWVTAKLNVDSAVLEWSHSLWTNDQYYTYPAITLRNGSSDGNVAVFGTWTNGTNRYPSAVYKIYDDQPSATTGPFELARSGVDSYVVLDGSGRNRWGDYSGAAYDWSCGHFVGAAEFADDLNSWSTQVRYMTSNTEPICKLIDISHPVDGASFVGGEPITVSWDTRSIPASENLFVYYSSDGGASWSQVSGALASTATSFVYSPPVFEDNINGKFAVGSLERICLYGGGLQRRCLRGHGLCRRLLRARRHV